MLVVCIILSMNEKIDEWMFIGRFPPLSFFSPTKSHLINTTDIPIIGTNNTAIGLI